MDIIIMSPVSCRGLSIVECINPDTSSIFSTPFARLAKMRLQFEVGDGDGDELGIFVVCLEMPITI